MVVYRYASRAPALRDYAPRASGPLLSVVIPARNEAVNIAECIRSIREARYAPPPLLKRMVMAGHLGRKSGRGFYTYTAETK